MSYKGFGLTELVDQGIQNDDMACVRRALANVCQFDRTFTYGRLEDGLEYVLKIKGLPKEKLYQDFNAAFAPLFRERVEQKDSTLTLDDFSNSVFWLAENFCEERIEDTRALGRFLFPEEAKKPAAQGGVRAVNPPRNDRRKDTMRLLLILGGAAAVVAAAVLVAKML